MSDDENATVDESDEMSKLFEALQLGASEEISLTKGVIFELAHYMLSNQIILAQLLKYIQNYDNMDRRARATFTSETFQQIQMSHKEMLDFLRSVMQENPNG